MAWQKVVSLFMCGVINLQPHRALVHIHARTQFSRPQQPQGADNANKMMLGHPRLGDVSHVLEREGVWVDRLPLSLYMAFL